MFQELAPILLPKYGQTYLHHLARSAYWFELRQPVQKLLLPPYLSCVRGGGSEGLGG